MRAIILGAGYGTRLEQDINNSLEYSHLRGLPKPLLPIRGKALISYWMEQIKESRGWVDETYIVTNNLFFRQFKEWARREGFPEENLVNDGTERNEERKGAIGDIALVVKEKKIDDDVLIVAGDILFHPDFDLDGLLIDFYSGKKRNIATCYKAKDEEEVRKRGILELDGSNRIINFWEKPNPEEVKSRWACPSFYVYTKETLGLLEQFLAETKEIKERDAPGNLLKWLYSRVPVYAVKIENKFDVGTLEDYKEADRFFEEWERKEAVSF